MCCLFTLKKQGATAIILASTCLAFVAQLAFLPASSQAEVGTWTDGDLPVLTVGEQIANPTTPIDCSPATFTYWAYTKPDGSSDSIGRPIDISACETENRLGFYGGSGTHDDYDMVRPGTAYSFQVFSANGNALSVTPVPEHAAFITKDSSQSFNGEVAPHFYDSFPAAGVFGPVNQRLAFSINKPGMTLRDISGTKIYMHAYAFSNNGEWMVIEVRGLGLVRVNTQTLDMQLFDPTVLSYGQGYTPVMMLAISNDGQTVLKSGKNASDTYAYDLSRCQPGSFTIGANNTAAMQGCSRRSLQASLKLQLANFLYLRDLKFNGDGKSISAVAARTDSSGITQYYSVTYAVAGYAQSQLDYLALGDSFSSGEGASNYELGTNEPENTCHLSKVSYPYLAAQSLGRASSFHSVACSGARAVDYDNGQDGQSKIMDSARNVLGVWQPGYQGQGKYALGAGKVSVVTISMIGNDIGFGDIIERCLAVADSCYHFKEDRQNLADLVHSKFSTLTRLYAKIKTDSGNKEGAKVYVLGYPQLIGDGPTCDLNVPIDQEERVMARHLLSYLNAIIRAAAQHEGVQYIDVENTFEGHENCQTGTKAVNGLTYDNNTPKNLNLTFIHGSFHPNAYGQQLLTEALVKQSESFTKPMPVADASIASPYVESAAYKAFIGDAPSGSALQHVLYIGSSELGVLYKATSSEVYVPHTLVQLIPNSTAEAWFNSIPTHAGTLTTDATGNISGTIIVPDSLTPGFHTLHLYATDVSGQLTDLYQTAYIAAGPDDYNGNGVPDNMEQCIVVPMSGIDQDNDGVDDACDGNIEPVPLDVTPPQVVGIPSRPADHDGWYDHDVTVSWLVTDQEPSSGSPTQPDVVLADQEGDHNYTSLPSCDPAGNCATGSIGLKLDKTSPSITFTIDPAPNPSGWNNGSVTVRFVCRDATSGIASCNPPVTLSGAEGTYIVTGTAADNAGNTAATNALVSIDATNPGVAQTAYPVANEDGWRNANTIVATTCTDSLSGMAFCSEPVVLAQEGAAQNITSVGIDTAGNIGTASTLINIDKTAPTIDGAMWTNNPKTTIGSASLTTNVRDNLSGVKHVEYYLGDIDPGLGQGTTLLPSGDSFVASFGTDLAAGVYTVTLRAQDLAGNWSAPTRDYLVVYSPFSIRVTGRHALVPLLANGDMMPGLLDDNQTTSATFAFSMGYDKLGNATADDFELAYNIGTNCSSPKKAQNCHIFSLSSSSIDWLTVYGANGSTAAFHGSGQLIIDTTVLQVTFKAQCIDGEKVGGDIADHLSLEIFTAGQNPATDLPAYRLSDDVARGTIHIKS